MALVPHPWDLWLVAANAGLTRFLGRCPTAITPDAAPEPAPKRRPGRPRLPVSDDPRTEAMREHWRRMGARRYARRKASPLR